MTHDRPPCGGCGRIGSAWTKGSCRFCWAWRETAEYQRKWGPYPGSPPPTDSLEEEKDRPDPADPEPSVPPDPSLPCAHRGAEIPGPERQELGLGHGRVYYRCALGLAKNRRGVAGVVCACAGCGPRCPSYRAIAAESGGGG